MSYGKVNALDAAFCEALVKQIEKVAAGPARALVITGTGTAFSAGVDLFQVLKGGAEYLGRFLPAMEAFFLTLCTFPKPAIGARIVNRALHDRHHTPRLRGVVTHHRRAAIGRLPKDERCFVTECPERTRVVDTHADDGLNVGSVAA